MSNRVRIAAASVSRRISVFRQLFSTHSTRAARESERNVSTRSTRRLDSFPPSELQRRGVGISSFVQHNARLDPGKDFRPRARSRFAVVDVDVNPPKNPKIRVRVVHRPVAHGLVGPCPICARLSNSLADRCKNDLRKSSLLLGLALNSDISRDRSDEYCRLGPVAVGSNSRESYIPFIIGCAAYDPGGRDTGGSIVGAPCSCSCAATPCGGNPIAAYGP